MSMTPEQRDKERWLAFEDAEAALASLEHALRDGDLERVSQYARDVAACVALVAEPEPDVPELWTCPDCGDTMPPGFDEDDHLNCNWPEDFAELDVEGSDR